MMCASVSIGASEGSFSGEHTSISVGALMTSAIRRADAAHLEYMTKILDTVIIAMAESLESAVMATMLCKEMGVETVIVKCACEMHRKILSRVGADQVVFPESESGARLAKNLLSAGFVDLLELARDVSMVEVNIRPEWVGKCLVELNLRRKYGINVVALRRGKDVVTDIDPEKPLTKDVRLLVIGNPARLSKLK
jgi:trk system potassium uptake protein TrkA